MPVPPAIARAVPRLAASMTGGRAAAGQRDTILLVEDDDMVATLIAQVLERRGAKVLRAGDGAEAVRLASANRDSIALALVDCGLPDVDGMELCATLRRALPGLPLLLTSGREYSAAAATLATDGPAGFLPKPFLPGAVLQQVQALLVPAG